jgi:hypothetical protein
VADYRFMYKVILAWNYFVSEYPRGQVFMGEGDLRYTLKGWRNNNEQMSNM